jgi:hypothetical protein
MLRKFTWIAAALLATLAMAFFGCTDAGTLDDGTAPRQANDLVIEGKDVVLAKMGSSAGQALVTIDGNKVTFKGSGVTSSGFYYEFPEAAADYPQVVVYFKVLSVTTGVPGLLIKNTDMTNYAGIVNDQDSRYQMNAVGGAGTEFNTGEKPTNAFKGGRIGFQHQAWNDGTSATGEINSTVEYTIEVVKIVFPGAGTVTDITPPTYTGDPEKINFTTGYATANRTDDIVVDSDPTVFAGYGMAVSATGVVTFEGKGRLNYKFPTKAVVGSGATAQTVDIDIEKDFDIVAFEFTVANGSGSAGATVYETVLLQFEGADADSYANLAQYGEYVTGNATGTSNGPANMQTWGAKGTGGFSIRANDYAWPVADGGNANGNKNVFYKFDIKLTKVTFTKAQRAKVTLFIDAQPGVTYDVLKGNTIAQSNIPSPTKVGYTFGGWVAADGTTPIGTSDGATNPTYTIETDTVGYAKWNPVTPQTRVENLPKGEEAATGTGTLFSPHGDYGTTTTPYNYTPLATGGVGTAGSYWIVSDARGGQFDDWSVGAVAPFNDDGDPDATPPTTDGPGAVMRDAIKAAQIANGTLGGYTRITIGVADITGADTTYFKWYDEIKITYDLVLLAGNAGILVRNGFEPGGGNPTIISPTLTAGTNQTLTIPLAEGSLNNGIGIVKNGGGAFLLRITKVEIYQK